MALLKNMDTGDSITRFVSMEIAQEVIRKEQTLLSGDTYLQRIGNASILYEVTAYANRVGKALLLQAEDSAALLQVTVKHGTYLGRITKLSMGERLAGDWFKAELTLCKESDA